MAHPRNHHNRKSLVGSPILLSLRGPRFFTLAWALMMQMKAEGFRKVEMKRAEVPSPPSKLFTYSFSAYHSWGDGKSKG